MAYRGFRKVPNAQSRQRQPIPQTFLAPTLGWVTGTNIAAAPALSCHTLENFVPTLNGVRLRLGHKKQATIGAAVQSLMEYVGGGTKKMFAASAASIFNITAPADPSIAPAADLTGFAGGYWSYQNFAGPGGNTMTICNGVDFGARQYDGAAWSIPGITNLGPLGAGTNLNTVLDHVWAYNERLFFTEPNTMRAYCLGTGAIAGAAVLINLAGVFTKGGSLKSGGTWSGDSGSGLAARCVFISTEGEVAVYQGINPADPNNWSKIGVYDVGPILGKRAMVQRGGELLLATQQGLIPLSAAINNDQETLSLFSLASRIEPDWIRDAGARRDLPWEIVKWPSRNLAYVNVPDTGATTDPWCYVVNTENGAWAKFTGWDTRCLVLHDDYIYFGTNAGTIMQAEITGADDGVAYTGRLGNAFAALVPGAYKTAVQARAAFRIADNINPQLSISSDYTPVWPTAPNASPTTITPGVWGVGLWGIALWGVGIATRIFKTLWVAIGQSGDFAVSTQLQITSGQEAPPSAELIQIDLMYQPGEIVV